MQHRKTTVLSAFLGSFLVIDLAGCSSSDPGTPAAGTGGTATGDAATGGHSSGAGGAGGGSAIGGATGTGGQSSGGGMTGAGGATITCGGSPCAPRYTPPCCTAPGTGVAGDKLEIAGRAPDLCGTDLSQYSDAIAGICLQINQPGSLDPSCPDAPSPTPGQPVMKGCCTDQGYCGAYEGFLPLGCSYAGGRGKRCGVRTDAGITDAASGDASDSRP